VNYSVFSTVSSFFSFFDAQQQVPVMAKIANKAPIIVSAIAPQETFHHANTITNNARINRHQHLFTIPSFL
jgi:hypothetical protein